jgi:hypothetical protein
MKLNKTSLIITMGLLLTTEVSIASAAAGRPRRTSAEDLAAVLAESERTAAEDQIGRDAKAARMSVREYTEVLVQSRRSAEEHAGARAAMAAVHARPDARVVAAAGTVLDDTRFNDPAYIRANMDQIAASNPAYKLIISLNLGLDEKTAAEPPFHKGGGAMEAGYKRAKLMRIIDKLEASH